MRSDGKTAIADDRFDVAGQHVPDLVRDEGSLPPCSLDPQPERRPHVHLQQAALDLREKLSAVEVEQHERSQREHHGDHDETHAMGDHAFQQHGIALTESLEGTLESLLEASKETALRLGRVMSLQNILRHRRHQGVGQNKGGQHREDDGLGHRREHPAGNAA